MITATPAKRYQDIRRNIGKIRDYLAQGGGADRVLADQGLYFDATRACLLEISEAATNLGALAELHEPEISWREIRSVGNYLRHQYDDLDMDAMARALQDLDRLDAACARALAR